ncbi:hypothetical protein S40288_01350 [Stachybotrys chartarum IBT 40288]|nr:hypothetical protein S40288_01350 [Stachybotrys chartarum IBT 40288]
MSYQYPPPPDDDLVGKAKPSFPLEHDALPQQLSTPVAKGQDFQPKTLGREAARSYASSSLPQQGMHPSTEPVLEDPSAVTAQGEKKKNRLGYHRISIACTHCRRRKIRCITSRDDQAHCVNCIRLKKECIFNPVTPPTPMDSFSKFAPRAPSSSRMLKSSSSSPSAPNYAFDVSKEPILPAVTVPGFQNLVLSSSPVNDGSSFSQATKGTSRSFERHGDILMLLRAANVEPSVQSGKPATAGLDVDGGHTSNLEVRGREHILARLPHGIPHRTALPCLQLDDDRKLVDDWADGLGIPRRDGLEWFSAIQPIYVVQ